MEVADLHPWDLTPKEAVALQRKIAQLVHPVTAPDAPWLDPDRKLKVAGIDCSIGRFSDLLVAGIIIWDEATQSVVEKHHCVMRTPFPYVPGLLTFREAPGVLVCARQVQTIPDVAIVDGAGIAHPRRLGIAAHLGLWLQIPTFGCAKSYLCGDFEPPGPERGDFSPLQIMGDTVGHVLRTRRNVKPVFCSPGPGISLADSSKLLLRWATKYRLPDVIRAAHDYVGEIRRTVVEPTAENVDF